MKTGTALERFLRVSDNGPIRALFGKGIAPGMVGSLGRCAETNRNEIVWVRGAAGSADEAWGCHKDAADTYSWTLLTPTGSRVQSATIAAGVVTLDGPWVSLLMVDTEGAAASDDLDTINGGGEGQRVTLNPVDAARTIVVKDGSGNLRTAGDHSMDHAQDTTTLVFGGNAWLETGRANNNT